MCRFEKAEYAACITGKDGTIKAETRQGYTFTVKVAPRDVHEFATHRDDAGRWELTDTLTGMFAGMRDFDTRKAVAEYAETDAFKAKFAEVAGTWGYTAQVEAFARVCDGEAFTLKEYRKAVRDRKRELEAQDLEGKARAQGLDVEATATEHADVTAMEFAPRKAGDVDREQLAKTIHALAVNRAANDPDARVEERYIDDDARREQWELAKAGRLVKTTRGNLDTWELDGEFLCCIERRYGKRKVNLCYPELTPKLHMEDKRQEPQEFKADEVKEPEPVKAEEPGTVEPEAVTIETVAERFRGKTNIMVMQKNARACIWVEGDTKPIKEDLKAMGFKWAPKRKGWYLRTA